jgi:hypothetical protein
MNTSRLVRIGALVAGIGIVGAWAAAGASAHVTVTAPGAAPTFKAIQTYSDGQQVAWIEEPAQGSAAQPEHPAPTLNLAAAAPAAASPSAPSSTAAAPSVTATPVASSTNGASKGAVTTGIVLGIIGVVLGAAALFVSLRRARAAGGDA